MNVTRTTLRVIFTACILPVYPVTVAYIYALGGERTTWADAASLAWQLCAPSQWWRI